MFLLPFFATFAIAVTGYQQKFKMHIFSAFSGQERCDILKENNVIVDNMQMWYGYNNANPDSCISVFNQQVNADDALIQCKNQVFLSSPKVNFILQLTPRGSQVYGARLVWVLNDGMQDFVLKHLGTVH